MKQVTERSTLPNQIAQGPNSDFLRFLLVALQTVIGEIGRRLNLTAPKDGSELQQMVSLDSVDFAVSGDVDDADIDEVKRQEVIDEFRRQAKRIRQRRSAALQSVAR